MVVDGIFGRMGCRRSDAGSASGAGSERGSLDSHLDTGLRGNRGDWVEYDVEGYYRHRRLSKFFNLVRVAKFEAR